MTSVAWAGMSVKEGRFRFLGEQFHHPATTVTFVIIADPGCVTNVMMFLSVPLEMSVLTDWSPCRDSSEGVDELSTPGRPSSPFSVPEADSSDDTPLLDTLQDLGLAFLDRLDRQTDSLSSVGAATGYEKLKSDRVKEPVMLCRWFGANAFLLWCPFVSG